MSDTTEEDLCWEARVKGEVCWEVVGVESYFDKPSDAAEDFGENCFILEGYAPPLVVEVKSPTGEVTAWQVYTQPRWVSRPA